jgi:protein tyrosine phosphatase (PTP) superfamily phosphohydrolase (DUF442 family)
MPTFIYVCRLGFAVLLFTLALVALPCSMAWSALPAQWLSSNPVRPQSWAQPIDKHLNLYRMEPDLYRSALPQASSQALLKSLGIATVINFYQRGDGGWLHDPLIRQVQLPLRTDRIDDADVLEVLRSIRQAQARGPVLIHCKHGQNRTGLIAALYRVVYQGWSKQQALAEMRRGGFGGEDRMGDAERYLRTVDIQRLQGALARGACSTTPWDMCTVKAWVDEALKG